MQPFIFAYGGKQLAEQMMGIKDAVSWDAERKTASNLGRIAANIFNPRVFRRAVPLAAELYAGYRPTAPRIETVHAELKPYARRLGDLVRRHSHDYKLTSKWLRDDIVTRQAMQARLADSAIYIFALTASLSRMDQLLGQGSAGLEFDRDRKAFEHAFDLFEMMARDRQKALRRNADESMREAARAARRYNDALPNEDFYIHEAAPIAGGSGKPIQKDHIRQFPGSGHMEPGGDGHAADAELKKDGRSAGKRRKSSSTG
jgi:hypothetical protein